MRARAVGSALAGLGVVALAVAVLGPVQLAASPVELAADASYESRAAGTDVSYLDPVTLTPRTGADVTVSVRVRSDASTGDADADTAVREYETTTYDTTGDGDGPLLTTTSTTVCLDRRTAEAVDCPVESVDGTRADVRGLTLAFPPGTEERDHDVWDGTVGQALPARFAGTEEFRGLAVQRYEQEVPEQVVGAVTVPGAVLGAPAEPALPAQVLHRGTRTLLVEPVSGVVVSTEESPRTTLRGPDGVPGAVLLSGTFTSTERTVDAAVARAREVLDRRDLLGTVVPWTAGGLGLLLAGAGGVLVVRGRPAAPAPEEDEPAPVPVPAG
jgi:hypothetical protein